MKRLLLLFLLCSPLQAQTNPNLVVNESIPAPRGPNLKRPSIEFMKEQPWYNNPRDLTLEHIREHAQLAIGRIDIAAPYLITRITPGNDYFGYPAVVYIMVAYPDSKEPMGLGYPLETLRGMSWILDENANPMTKVKGWTAISLHPTVLEDGTKYFQSLNFHPNGTADELRKNYEFLLHQWQVIDLEIEVPVEQWTP